MAQILRKYQRALIRRSFLNQQQVCIRYFSSTQEQQSQTQDDQSQQQTNEPPPVFDYQAPKDDNQKNYESHYQFIRRYFIIFPLAAYCLYEMMFVKKNEYSRNREFKFINSYCERALGHYISSRFIAQSKNYIYKQDTEEVVLIKQTMQNIIEKNDLQDKISSDIKVTLIHNDTLFMFLNLDQRLIITIPALKFSKLSEEELSLLICHEIAHYLLDHQVLRILKSFLLKRLYAMVNLKNAGKHDLNDPVRIEFKQKIDKFKYSCFYPQQRVSTKFYEKNCDIFAIQLWKKAYPNIDHEEIANDLFGSIDHHIDTLSFIDKRENFNEHYTYSRKLANQKIIRAQADVKIVT